MNRLITSVIFGLVGINSVLHADPTRPRLVVGIVVDQLRSDYMEYLRDLFGENGFNRLLDSGVYIRDIDFKDADLDFPAAAATAMTGDYPAANGIVADMTDFKSPAQLRLSTISDEIAIDGGGMSAVYSIAPDALTASILAGHAGNSAVWINPLTGEWSSSDYFGQLPHPAANANRRSPLASRTDTIRWRPVLPLDKYPGIPYQKKLYDFTYTFPRSDKSTFERLSVSPIANREITDLAIEYLKSLKLGNRTDAIDVLNIGYTAAPYKYGYDGDFRLELEDSYIRLDSQLARLIGAIDRYVGLDKTLLYLTSTGYYDDASPDDPKFRIPSGELSVKRLTSLLNSFLSAKYGNGDYIERYSRGRITLNRRTLDAHRADPTAAADEARTFLSKMQGVAEAYTLAEVLSPLTPGIENIRLSVDPDSAGDIYIRYSPGWIVVDDLSYPSTNRSVRTSGAIATPAFIMAPHLGNTTFNSPVSAEALAPTISGLLHIRSPNGSRGKPIPLSAGQGTQNK